MPPWVIRTPAINWGAENRTGSSGVNFAAAPANNTEWAVNTTGPAAGGTQTIRYDVSAKKPGTYQSVAAMSVQPHPGHHPGRPDPDDHPLAEVISQSEGPPVGRPFRMGCTASALLGRAWSRLPSSMRRLVLVTEWNGTPGVARRPGNHRPARPSVLAMTTLVAPLRRPPYHRVVTALRIALLASLCGVAACSASGGDPSGSFTRDSEQPTQSAASRPGAPSGTIDLPTSITDAVVADIARLAGVTVDQVTILSAERVTFPDGGLGCPVPGMAYTQVQVDGYRIVALAGGRSYDYRGSGSTFRLCDPKAQPTGSGS